MAGHNARGVSARRPVNRPFLGEIVTCGGNFAYIYVAALYAGALFSSLFGTGRLCNNLPVAVLFMTAVASVICHVNTARGYHGHKLIELPVAEIPRLVVD